MSGNLQTHPESILVVRLGAMGDVLHAMPAVASLRKAFPQTRIGWVVEQRWSELLVSQDEGAAAMFRERPLIDALHTVDTRTWRKKFLRPSIWRDVRRSIGVMRSEKYAVAIDFQGAIKSALLARVSDASETFGFAAPRESVAKLWYTNQVNATVAHVIDQNLQLASAIARQPLAAEVVDLPRSARAEHWCEEFLQDHGIGHFALLSPGSGWGAKCWPAERYAEVAQRLGGAGLKSLINYGPSEEALASSVVAASAGTAETISCNVAQLLALTRRASLFVGGDSGPMHLASALKVPTVALFGPTDPARNGPYWKPSIVIRSDQSVTSYKHVPQADAGLHSITADTVVAASAQLLGVPIG